ncbi:NUDIX hydrolase [Diaphorobacter aerolatus]|uniref:NUDIX domain-containing protein n=1 Tax=Diaphorobacter aerolatus TaxID=1288495 RepID=A0A7H0GNG9_9BURK|nr:NUDIX domain-containing protein [Diaphorobacter aerolatus]QNP49835.1 NUDIX domain-containing protein [Diaphorobacter aerolatus]
MASADLTPAPAWLAAARAHAKRPTLRLRMPFVVDGEDIGSVETQVIERVAGSLPGGHRLFFDEGAWQLQSAAAGADGGANGATAAMNALARAMREAGLSGPWRDEQLAVCNEQGQRIGTIERGLVRPLAIATRAVHLIGASPDGRMWVQQRAFDKANHPGMWDTLMGGMVSADDSLEQALARETWEEAGLRIADLQDLRHGGHVDFAQPAEEEDNAGYMRERIDWFGATIPENITPENQDGEVERFELWTVDKVRDGLANAAFTPEAALLLAAYFGW